MVNFALLEIDEELEHLYRNYDYAPYDMKKIAIEIRQLERKADKILDRIDNVC